MMVEHVENVVKRHLKCLENRNCMTWKELKSEANRLGIKDDDIIKIYQNWGAINSDLAIIYKDELCGYNIGKPLRRINCWKFTNTTCMPEYISP